MRLCDDLPDRDFERFDTAALPVLAELFRGKTGIADHQWSAERQVARIFDTEVLPDGAANYIRAQCYLLRTEKNAELIAEIEGGIKKEVSVGCAMAKSYCSICGAQEPCAHIPGERYDGNVCVRVWTEPTDAYEFSFVAVPAQKSAGVLKAKCSAAMTLKELVGAQNSQALCADLSRLEEEARFGRQQREAAEARVVSFGLLCGFGKNAQILRKCVRALDAAELAELCEAMQAHASLHFQTQLPHATKQGEAVDMAYLI